MFGIIKKYLFDYLLVYLMDLTTKSAFLSNQKIQPTLINLNPNKYSQEFHNCPFSLTLSDLSSKVCIQKKQKI